MGKYEEALERAKQGMPIDEVFPELKESEDERIRKELWEYFHDLQLSSDSDFSPSFTIDDILAYLERQKYEYEVFEPIENTLEYKAGFKAGVEASVKSVDFDKQKEQKPLSTEETELNSIAFLEELGYTCIPIHSLAGCVDDKMVLKKIEASAKEYYKRNYEGGNPQGKGVVIQSYIDGASEWLEKKEQKPTDSEEIFESVDNAFRRGREVGFREGVESVKTVECSEEDRKNIADFLYELNVGFTQAAAKDRAKDILSIIRPQPHWKPSEAQMKVLKEAADMHWEPDGLDPLYSLYNDLKKL